jgi:uncharacterized MAPEG superfamily protein
MYLRGGKYNNASPRGVEMVRGFPLRARSAHFNAVESYAPFAVAVVLNLLFLRYPNGVTKANVAVWTILIKECILFLTARLAHLVLYLLNLSSLRSLAWMIGSISIVNLFMQVVV